MYSLHFARSGRLSTIFFRVGRASTNYFRNVVGETTLLMLIVSLVLVSLNLVPLYSMRQCLFYCKRRMCTYMYYFSPHKYVFFISLVCACIEVDSAPLFVYFF